MSFRKKWKERIGSKKSPDVNVSYVIMINLNPATMITGHHGICDEHKKPITIVSTIDGELPRPMCIECLTDLMHGLSEICEEYTAAESLTKG